MEFQNYTTHQSDWISFLIVAIALVYGLLLYNGTYQFKFTHGQFFSGDGINANKNALAKVLLNTNTIAILGLFVYASFAYIETFTEVGYILFFRIIFGILLLVALQRLVIQLHSILTNTFDFFKKYLAIQNHFAHLAAFSAMPFLVLSMFSKVYTFYFLVAGVSVFGGLYLFGILKSIALSNRIKGPLKFHLIFYLCGNEILPFFLFYKILI